MDTKIKSSFWTDSEVETISPEQRLAFLWILTNSQIGLCGFFEASTRRFAFETGLPEKALWETVEALPRALKGFRDKNIIYARRFIQHQLGSGNALERNNIFKSLMAEFQMIRHQGLISALLEDYPEIGRACQGLAKGLPTPCQGGREREREEKEKEKESGEEVQKEGNGHSPLSKIEVGQWCTKILDAYPRKDSAADCAHALCWVLENGKDQTPAEILADVEECARWIAIIEKDGKSAFVPSAASFFSKRKWTGVDNFEAQANEARRNRNNGKPSKKEGFLNAME